MEYMDSITPHCPVVSINKGVFTADSGPRFTIDIVEKKNDDRENELRTFQL